MCARLVPQHGRTKCVFCSCSTVFFYFVLLIFTWSFLSNLSFISGHCYFTSENFLIKTKWEKKNKTPETFGERKTFGRFIFCLFALSFLFFFLIKIDSKHSIEHSPISLWNFLDWLSVGCDYNASCIRYRWILELVYIGVGLWIRSRRVSIHTENVGIGTCSR